MKHHALVLFFGALFLLTGCFGENQKTDSQLQNAGNLNVEATMKSKTPSNYSSVRTDGRRYNIKIKTKSPITSPLIIEAPQPTKNAEEPKPTPPIPSVTEEEKRLTTSGTESIKNTEKTSTESGWFYVLKYGSYALYLVCLVGGAIAMKIFYGKEIAMVREGAVAFKNLARKEASEAVNFARNLMQWATPSSTEHAAAEKMKLKLEAMQKSLED